MEAQLIAQMHDEHMSIHCYRFWNGNWTFISHDDPGLDVLVQPNGIEVCAYDPFDGKPEGIPEELWEQFLKDIGALL